jgi:hypothetical protein
LRPILSTAERISTIDHRPTVLGAVKDKPAAALKRAVLDRPCARQERLGITELSKDAPR